MGGKYIVMSLTPSGYMMTKLEEDMFQLILDLIDETPCKYISNLGTYTETYCYQHHYDTRNDPCPQQIAKDLIKEYGFEL